jgi:hypothetical protein
MLSISTPVFALKLPVLQNNRKVSRRFWQLPARAGEFRKGGLFFLARNLFWPEIFKKFPVPASENQFRSTASATTQSLRTGYFPDKFK